MRGLGRLARQCMHRWMRLSLPSPVSPAWAESEAAELRCEEHLDGDAARQLCRLVKTWTIELSCRSAAL